MFAFSLVLLLQRLFFLFNLAFDHFGLFLVNFFHDLFHFDHLGSVFAKIDFGSTRSVNVGQLLLQFHDFLLELTKHGVFRVFVDNGVILDVFCTVGIAKCGERLVKVEVGRAQIGYHDGLGITTKRVLQQTGEFRVSVGNMSRFTINQSRNHVTQSGKTLVDINGFFEAVALSLSL